MSQNGSLEPKRVLVVDDHNTFAELLVAAIDREPDLTSVGHATTAGAGVAMFAETVPDVVLMDLQLPDMDGFAATAQIMRDDPQARVIMLTAHVSGTLMARAFAVGACGFVGKNGHLSDILRVLRSATRGGIAVDSALLAELLQEPNSTPAGAPGTLSGRELGVLTLLAEGLDVSAIAHELELSQNTVRGYVKAILAKLSAHSQLEAVVIAARLGLVNVGGDRFGGVKP